MSCYLRHLKTVFSKADIVIDKSNRPVIDSLVRAWSNQAGIPCNLAWKEIKAQLAEKGEENLISFLKANR